LIQINTGGQYAAESAGASTFAFVMADNRTIIKKPFISTSIYPATPCACGAFTLICG